MPRTASIIKFEAILFEAIEKERWEPVGQARERLLQLLLRSLRARAPSDVKRIESALSEAHRMIVLRFGVSREMNEVAHAWGVLAEARAASLAIRQMPEPYPALNAQQANVRDRMLRRLNEPGCRRSNRELANDIGAAEATIARALTELRRQGLVLSWSAGRAMVNQLTEAGVLAANALKPQPPPPVVHEEGIRMLAANSISDVDSVSRKFEDRKRELLRRDLREKERVAALVPT